MSAALLRWSSVVLLAATAFAAAALAWARLSEDESPTAVLAILPWHPGAQLEASEADRNAGEADPTELAATGRQIFRLAPLMDAPLVLAGLEHVSRGDEPAARRAFEAAVRRQPRNVPALSWLAAVAVRDGRYEDAMRLLDQLWRVDPDRRDIYAQALASIVLDPSGAALVESAVADGSPIALAAVENVLGDASDLDLVMQLVAAAPSLKSKAVQRVVRERGLEAGFIAWLSLRSEAEARTFSWPYDPAFVEGEAPPPFNWQLGSDAERLPEGGLLVRYSGRGSPLFASQVMLLGPGSYRFSAEMDGDLSGTGGVVYWELQCLPANRSLGQVPALSSTKMMSTHTFDFTVPQSDCRVQSLTLKGRPGEFAQRVRATVRHVSMVPDPGGMP